MTGSIGTYSYVYGAGSSPNRMIKFYPGSQEGTICAKIMGKAQGRWQVISELTEDLMLQEGASTSEKVRRMMEARDLNQSPIYPKNKPFSTLCYKDKVSLIESLQPEGTWRIEIRNTIGDNPYFEQIDHLCFFNPS